MKKKKLWLIGGIVLAVVLCMGLGVWYMAANSLGISEGNVMIMENGTCILVVDERTPIVLSNVRDKEGLFDGLTTGDAALVLHDGIQETYPAGTGAYAVWKQADGSLEDIPQTVLDELTELGWKLAQ